MAGGSQYYPKSLLEVSSPLNNATSSLASAYSPKTPLIGGGASATIQPSTQQSTGSPLVTVSRPAPSLAASHTPAQRPDPNEGIPGFKRDLGRLFDWANKFDVSTGKGVSSKAEAANNALPTGNAPAAPAARQPIAVPNQQTTPAPAAAAAAPSTPAASNNKPAPTAANTRRPRFMPRNRAANAAAPTATGDPSTWDYSHWGQQSRQEMNGTTPRNVIPPKTPSQQMASSTYRPSEAVLNWNAQHGNGAAVNSIRNEIAQQNRGTAPAVNATVNTPKAAPSMPTTGGFRRGPTDVAGRRPSAVEPPVRNE